MKKSMESIYDTDNEKSKVKKKNREELIKHSHIFIE